MNIRSIADSQGWNWEDLWAHFNVNFSFRPSPAVAGWKGMERFDAFDSGNGVLFSSNGTTFTDRTTQAYAGTPSPLTHSMYVGSSEPFDLIKITLGNAPGGCNATWQFWDGSIWSNAIVTGDSTRGFVASGSVLITPSPSWRRTQLNGGKKKWWVRVVVSNCSTPPSVTRLHGDDLTTGAVNTFGNPQYRGWCAVDTDGSRLNTNLAGEAAELEYDPNPPAACQARFRWQARMLGIWGSNLMLFNYPKLVSGVSQAAKTIAEYMRPRVVGGSANTFWKGVFLDDMYKYNTKDVTEPSTSNSCLNGSCPSAGACGASVSCHSLAIQQLTGASDVGPLDSQGVDTALGTLLSKTLEYMQEYLPAAKVGANTDSAAASRVSHMQLIETGNLASGSFRYPNRAYNSGLVAWDDFNKPGCPTRTLMAVSDTVSEIATPTGWYGYDRGKRGPLAALAGFYIHTNPCTDLFYTVANPSWYTGSDDYTYWKEAPDWTIAGTTRSGNGSLLFGTFTGLSATYNSSVNVASISNNIVTLNNTMSGLAAGQWVWIQGTTNAAHNVLVQVASSMGNAFSVTSGTLPGTSTGGTARLEKSGSVKTMRIGDLGEYVPVWKISDTVLGTSKRLNNTYSSGTAMWSLHTDHLGNRLPESIDRVVCYGSYFSALDVDIGVPDATSGIVGDAAPYGDGLRGSRKMVWQTAAESRTKYGVARRDFTKAIILWGNSAYTFPTSVGGSVGAVTKTQFETYSPAFPVVVNGTAITVYPLSVNGRTNNAICNYGSGEDFRTPDGGCSQVKIRTAEGLVLMKSPIP